MVIRVDIITKSMCALWLVNQLWFVVPVNSWKNRAFSELLYKSNRPQVSMVYSLENHLGCWQNTICSSECDKMSSLPVFYVDKKFTHQVIYFNTKWSIFLCQVENLYIKFIVISCQFFFFKESTYSWIAGCLL